MSDGETVLGLIREIQAMPENRVRQELQSLRYSVFTLEGNYQDLRAIIEDLPHQADMLFNRRHHDKLEQYLLHIGRLIHNFVAATYSLLERTDNLYRDLNVGPNKFGVAPRPFPDHSQRKDAEFGGDGLTQFMKRLRVYCQHFQLPAVELNITFTRRNAQETMTIHLSKAELLGFDENWSGTAKRFLHAQPDSIDILSIITAYRDKVMAFYEWFMQREREIFADELGKVRAKEQRIAFLTINREIDALLAGASPLQKEDVFLNIFDSRDYDRLGHTPPHSRERADVAIQLLGAKMPISKELQGKVVKLFTTTLVSQFQVE